MQAFVLLENVWEVGLLDNVMQFYRLDGLLLWGFTDLFQIREFKLNLDLLACFDIFKSTNFIEHKIC